MGGGVNNNCLEIMHVMVINRDSNLRKISSSGSCYKKGKELGLVMAAKSLGSSLFFLPLLYN